MTTKRFDLYTEGPVAKQLFWMTLPMIGGMLTNVLYNLADTLFVGHLGEQGWDSVIDPGYGKVALAAMGCTFSVVVFCGSFGMGINTGLSSVLSRIIGGGDPHRPRQVATDGLILSVLASVMLTVIGLATIDPVFALLKTPAEAMSQVDATAVATSTNDTTIETIVRLTPIMRRPPPLRCRPHPGLPDRQASMC